MSAKDRQSRQPEHREGITLEFYMACGATSLRLDDIRKRHGISLEQISDQTKISTRFLRAIETEEFEKLPGGVFNTNYIRQYASSIGFPEDQLLDCYSNFEQTRQKAEADVQAQCEARRGWTVRWSSWLTEY